MDIEIFGGGERVRAASRLLASFDFSDIENINSLKLFPIPTSRDGVHISGTELLLDDAVTSFGVGDYAIGYSVPKRIKEKLNEKGVEVYDASYDEDFLTENAYITALGTLCYILGSSSRIPGGMKFGIIGYGRIGKALFRILMFVGARVKVFSSKPLTRLELGEAGAASAEFSVSHFKLSDVSGIDILINTAPCNLSGAFPDKELPQELRVIDLATGDSFPGVKGVEYLPSLPDRMYPESAAEAYARHAYQSIVKNNAK